MYSRLKKSIVKVFMLLLVYSLHLLFLQVLMIAPDDNFSESLKNYFSKNQERHNSHPAAAHYYQVHKHDNKDAAQHINLLPISFDCSLFVYNSLARYTSTHIVAPEICNRLVTPPSERYLTCGILLI